MRLPVFSWLFLMAIYSLFLSIRVFGVSGQCIGNQQSLLLQLKNNLTFDPAMSKKLVKWNQSVDCCSWEGVTCKEGRVIGLDLASESISGGLDNSSSLFNLQHLQSLSLADNDFNYSHIPSEFEKLVNLRYLNLSHDVFAGQIPIAISRLKRLVTLDLSTNSYSLTLENPNLNMLVQNLSELIELYLDGVPISAQGKEWCRVLSSSLPNLRVLSLSNCNLSGPIDSFLRNLQSLSIIRLNGNKFSAPIPEFFADYKNLTSLEVSDSKLNGKFPEKIFQVPTLQMLDLSYNYDLQGSLPEFPPNGSLRTMLLRETRFFGTLPPSIGNLKMLSMIDMSYCNFNGSIPSSMARLTELVYLDMSFNSFNGSIPSSMARLTELVYLDMSFNSFNGSIPIFSMTKNMEILDLTRNSLSGQIPICLFSLSSLRELLLSKNKFSGQINNKFSNISSHLLETLDLSSNNLEGPICLFSLPSLRELQLSNNQFSGQINKCSNISSQSLEMLDLSFNNLEGPICLFSLPSLQELQLSNNQFSGQINKCSNISSQSLEILDLSFNNLEGPICLFSLPSLRELQRSNNQFSGQINKCSNISSQSLEMLDLSFNNLEGPICLFSLPSLRELWLSNNQFSGQINNSNISSHLLEMLDLSSNNLEGPIPIFISELQGLKILSLSSNHFNSSLQLGVIQQLKNLSDLDISHNKLKTIPDFLRNQSNLQFLSLSNNQIYGEIPNWLLKLPTLKQLDLSYNFLATLEGPILNLSLRSVNLRSNQLRGPLPIISSVYNLDLSRNNFHSSIPASINWSLASTEFISLSSNKLYGSIPRSICNATNLRHLDLSNNSFSGTIPECLIAGPFWVLDLSTNNLNGTISNTFQHNCDLLFLALNGNQLGGELPKHLASCTKLELLDVGNNGIEDTFPFYLKNTSTLEVLVLRSNKFYGPIAHLNPNATWPLLQIVDVALNNFTGRLPIIPQSNWTAMMGHEEEVQFMFRESVASSIGTIINYNGTVTITIKGSPLEIQTIHTTLDFSCNNFDGPIPEEIGELTSLYILNLSHNALTGQIPPSLGKLRNLESLDLSSNELSGKIPVQLADGLISLSVLNLSFNQLVGPIPFIKQFAALPETSFKGNEGLCGLPLNSKCTYEKPPLSPPTYEESHSNSRILIEWNYISAELGFIFGFGIVIGPLMFWKRWRIWYYKHVDDILFKIFPKLYLGNEYRRR